MAYKIPNNIEYITYEVQDGDTYESIANANGITISEIVVLNDFDALDMNTLYVGSILRVGLREKSTGKVIETSIRTDDQIEKVFKDASLQTISVDSVTQATLDAIKERYSETGTLDSVKEDITYLADLGYTRSEIDYLLNDYSIDLSLDNHAGRKLFDELEKRYEENTSTINNTYDDSDLSRDTILGLPFRYNTYADPRRRVYNSSFMAEPAVLSIIPGKPLFRSSKDGRDGKWSSIINLFDSDDSNGDQSILAATKSMLLGEESDDAILSWLKKNQKSNAENGDLRYYRFQDDYLEFEKYLDLNISTLAVKMGIGNFSQARYRDFMRNIDADSLFNISHAFKFYCTKSGTSTTESISNEFSDPTIAGTMNTVSEAAQELRYLLGGSADSISAQASTLASNLTSSVEGIVGSLLGKESATPINQLGGAISSAAYGNKLIWPQIWKNSNFSRTYNFSFEFMSPYGSPEAIFRYVYLPFLTLLTLASPKQYGTSGYSNPFLVRIDMPGYCTSDLSVIQQMSWRKGGNDGLFTNDGLPLAITVDITVQDLYPTMAMSKTWSELRHNTGMHGFLDNIAGLSVQRFTPWQNVKNALNIRAVNLLGNLERDTIGRLTSKIYAISTSNSIFGSAYNS